METMNYINTEQEREKGQSVIAYVGRIIKTRGLAINSERARSYPPKEVGL